MAEACFADNLYGSPELAHLGGCGQFATCDAAAWLYERHARECKPGLWSVGLTGSEPGDFWRLLSARMDAVVDDFGNLAAIQKATAGENE
jgi:hypothetical protein